MKKQQKAWFYIDGKDVLLDVICINPQGNKMYKHLKTHHDGFRKYCLECGQTL